MVFSLHKNEDKNIAYKESVKGRVSIYDKSIKAIMTLLAARKICVRDNPIPNGTH